MRHRLAAATLAAVLSVLVATPALGFRGDYPPPPPNPPVSDCRDRCGIVTPPPAPPPNDGPCRSGRAC